jgi:hypothetical protein
VWAFTKSGARKLEIVNFATDPNAPAVKREAEEDWGRRLATGACCSRTRD